MTASSVALTPSTDFAEVALVLAGVGARSQLALDGGFGQHAGVGDQRVHGIDAGVQVVLDLVEVAVVVIGDPGRNVALRDPVNILGRDIERANDRVQRGVDAFDDFAEVALVLAGVGARGQLALDGGLRQNTGVGDQRVHGIDAGVQVVLDLVEVAVVVVGDPGRNVAFRNPVHILRRNIERTNDRIQRGVDSLDDFAIVALVLAGIGACGQLAFYGGFSQQSSVSQHRVQRLLLRRDVGGILDHFEGLAIEIHDRVVGCLNPDLLAALADALVLRRLVFAAVQRRPELLVLGALPVGLVHKHAVVPAFDLIQRVTQGLQKIVVGGEDRAVHLEFDHRLRLCRWLRSGPHSLRFAAFARSCQSQT